MKARVLSMFWVFDALRKLRYAHCVIPQGWIALRISPDLHRKRLFNANEKHYARCRTKSTPATDGRWIQDKYSVCAALLKMGALAFAYCPFWATLVSEVNLARICWRFWARAFWLGRLSRRDTDRELGGDGSGNRLGNRKEGSPGKGCPTGKWIFHIDSRSPTVVLPRQC